MWGRKDQEEDRPATGSTSPSQPESTGRQTSTAPAAQRPASSGSQSRRAIIGPSIQVKGELIGREDLVIEGYVEGVVRLKDHHLTVGETADLKATLEAKAIRIEGKVDGDIVAGERVELASGSTVLGDIKSPRISIADGARFKGSVDMEQSGGGTGSSAEKAGVQSGSQQSGAAAKSSSESKSSGPDKPSGSQTPKGGGAS
jgi:cytoskeletal protein CcmA (bactofilin family)